MKKYIFGILYGLALTAFTVYVLLDTFLIPRAYAPIATAPEVTDSTQVTQTTENTAAPTETTENEIVTVTADRYQDSNISITLTEYRQYDTNIYVADVQLSSAEYLKTAFAQGTYGRNIKETTSDMAEDNGAILAINGDYYGARESGYVLRNGVLYRDESGGRMDLAIYGDGSFKIINEDEVSASSLLESGARQVMSFGPALVMYGQIAVTKDQEVGQATVSNPRTAIGIVDELHYLLVVSDGRIDESEGLSLYEMAQFMQSLGAVTAYNLDGGGSSTMYFNGRVVNNPVNHGSTVSERKVSDIVYIGY